MPPPEWVGGTKFAQNCRNFSISPTILLTDDGFHPGSGVTKLLKIKTTTTFLSVPKSFHLLKSLYQQPELSFATFNPKIFFTCNIC